MQQELQHSCWNALRSCEEINKEVAQQMRYWLHFYFKSQRKVNVKSGFVNYLKRFHNKTNSGNFNKVSLPDRVILWFSLLFPNMAITEKHHTYAVADRDIWAVKRMYLFFFL